MGKKLKKILDHVQLFTGGELQSGDLYPGTSRNLIESLQVEFLYSGVSILGKQALAKLIAR